MEVTVAQSHMLHVLCIYPHLGRVKMLVNVPNMSIWECFVKVLFWQQRIQPTKDGVKSFCYTSKMRIQPIIRHQTRVALGVICVFQLRGRDYWWPTLSAKEPKQKLCADWWYWYSQSLQIHWKRHDENLKQTIWTNKIKTFNNSSFHPVC